MKMQTRLLRFRFVLHYRKLIKSKFKNHKIADLSKSQKKSITQYYKSQGYNNIRLTWHKFFIGSNNIFSTKYLPDEIFHPFVQNSLNSAKQWPALLDKNLLEVLFKGYLQPESVLKNINGMYFINDKAVTEEDVIEKCKNSSERLVIKPSIESGGGKKVFDFYVNDSITTYKNFSLTELLRLFKKDFIIQKVLSQNKQLKQLNSSSLNTLRIMSYLKDNKVYVISTVLRIGKSGMFTDNSSSGGIVCGVSEKGFLKEYGYYSNGKRTQKTDSGYDLKEFEIPSYDLALKMVKEMHYKVPNFKIISCDVAINVDNQPVLIEYNTYRQDIRIHQLANGPVFENYLSEFLEIGKSRS
jgi:hypothetical protein